MKRLNLFSSVRHPRRGPRRGDGDVRERMREALQQQRERRQDDQGGAGQEARSLLALRRRGGVQLQHILRVKELHVHVLRGEPRRVRLEVLLMRKVSNFVLCLSCVVNRSKGKRKRHTDYRDFLASFESAKRRFKKGEGCCCC